MTKLLASEPLTVYWPFTKEVGDTNLTTICNTLGLFACALGLYHHLRDSPLYKNNRLNRLCCWLGQTHGNPVDTGVYPEATYLQDPWPEANLVKFNYLIGYLARYSNNTIHNN